MPFTLSLNANPFVNRYAEPEDLIETIAERVRIRDIQLIYDCLNPTWPAAALSALTKRMRASLHHAGARVTSGIAGPYGRLAHFGHLEAGVRAYYPDRFNIFSDVIGDLGGASIGTQFAIFTYREYDDSARRKALIVFVIDCWGIAPERAKAAGLAYVFWEQISVGREFGQTLQACMALQDRLDRAGFAVPMKMMADIDHGDVASANPDGYDPYCGARAVPRRSPIIHIKQSMLDKGGQRPFTAEATAKGRIHPQPLLAAFAEGRGVDNEICLELSFKERKPNDRQVIAHVAESVAFWAPRVETCAGDLKV